MAPREVIRSDGSGSWRRNSMRDRLRGQELVGACRSKRLVAGEHVPDRFGEFAGDGDGGDLGAALGAVAGAGALADRRVARVADRVVGGLDQGPAEVARAVLGEAAP